MPKGEIMSEDIQKDVIFLRNGNFYIWLDKKWDCPPVVNFLFNIESFSSNSQVKFLRQLRNKVMEGKIQKDNEDIHLIVKQFGVKSLYDKIRFTFVKSKALRSFLNAKRLQKINIGTPEPIACIEKRKRGFLLTSYYISKKVYYDFDFSEIDKVFEGDTSLQITKNIFSYLARTIKKMHSYGIVFGDLNNRNILINKSKGNITFFFVDLNRMKARRKIGVLKSIFDLSWLHIPQEYKIFFFKEYSEDNFSYHLKIYTIIKKYRLLIDKTKFFFRQWFCPKTTTGGYL